ncbi:MAG: hypothetical protein AAF561_14795 [Planctomycetota bacterium]
MPASASTFLKAALLAAVAGAAGGGAYWWQERGTAKDRVIEQQEREIAYLQDVAERLTLEERIARIVVTGQRRNSGGDLETDLLFFDVGRDGEELPAQAFTVLGERVHISALVIRFGEADIARGDALRGKSIFMWDAIHGSATSPERAQAIDPHGDSPRLYEGEPEAIGLDDQRAQFERELWQDFWDMAREPAVAEKNGVKVAFGQQVFGIFEPGRIYEVSLQANGGMTLYANEMPPLTRELLKAISSEVPE